MKFIEYLEDRRVQVLVFIIILGISLAITFKENDINNRIKGYNTLTIGKIIDQYSIGVSQTYYVKYSFKIEGKVYTNSINYSRKFIDCYITRKCIGKKFVVYYNPNNPEESYIDFDDER